MAWIAVTLSLIIGLKHAIMFFIPASGIRVVFEVSEEFFHCLGYGVIIKEFISIMPWLAVREKNLPEFTEGEQVAIAEF